MFFCFRKFVFGILLVLGLSSLVVGGAYAGVISTESTLGQPASSFDRAELSNLLSTEASRLQLQAMGVSPETAEARLASLTDSELKQFSDTLQNAPVGEGTAGILLAVFIVFVITDMMCATDIFGFVKCVNN